MLHFYVPFAILFTLGLLRLVLSKSKSTLPTFLTLSLAGCLCFCVFSTFLTLLSIDTECVLVSSNQFGFKDTVSTLSNNKPFVCFSPSEETLKTSRYVVWVGSGVCAFSLFTSSQIAWVILRKLSYTQNLVNKLNDRGWPEKLFFWIRHPDPGVVDGKPLFHFMVVILVLNIIVLYTLMKMIYLVS